MVNSSIVPGNGFLRKAVNVNYYVQTTIVRSLAAIRDLIAFVHVVVDSSSTPHMQAISDGVGPPSPNRQGNALLMRPVEVRVFPGELWDLSVNGSTSLLQSEREGSSPSGSTQKDRHQIRYHEGRWR